MLFQVRVDDLDIVRWQRKMPNSKPVQTMASREMPKRWDAPIRPEPNDVRSLLGELSNDQIATIRSSGSMRRRSSGSAVITGLFANLAQTTTEASTTSLRPLRPHSTPAARAPASSSGTTDTLGKPRNRESRAWRGVPRQACASTPDGTLNITPAAQASSRRACIRRDARSIPMRAPVSNVTPEVISDKPEGFAGPAAVSLVRRSGLGRHIR